MCAVREEGAQVAPCCDTHLPCEYDRTPALTPTHTHTSKKTLTCTMRSRRYHLGVSALPLPLRFSCLGAGHAGIPHVQLQVMRERLPPWSCPGQWPCSCLHRCEHRVLKTVRDGRCGCGCGCSFLWCFFPLVWGGVCPSLARSGSLSLPPSLPLPLSLPLPCLSVWESGIISSSRKWLLTRRHNFRKVISVVTRDK